EHSVRLWDVSGLPAAPPASPAITGWASKETAPKFKLSTAGNLAWLVAFTDGGQSIVALDGERLWQRPAAGGAWAFQNVAATCREQFKAEPRRSGLSADGKVLAL